MFSRRVLFGLLAAACLLAAGGGAYLASRQSGAVWSTPAQLTTSGPDQDTQALASQTGGAVSETEAVIGDETATQSAADAGLAAAPTTTIASEPVVSRRTPPASARQLPSRDPSRAPSRSVGRRDSSSAPESRSSQNRARSSQGASGTGAADSGYSALEKPWPSRDTTTEAAPEAPGTRLEPEAPAAAPVPEKKLEELVVSAGSVIGLQVETAVNSERAKVEDRVEARVTRDVTVGDDVAIPAGARAIGSITTVDRGGKVKDRARLGIRFHTIVLADGTRLPIQTETIFREGASPVGESAAKIGGGAVGGAIIGAILGGTKGAVLGGSAGAAGGTAAVMAGGRNEATLPAGATLTVRLSSPATVTVEK